MPDRQPVSKTRGFKGLNMLDSLESFKKLLIIAITFTMGIVLLLATVDLGYTLYIDIVDSPPHFLLSIQEMLTVFGVFPLVLIGIELFETMEIYIKENVVHIEVVLTVALIALARKVIILDVKKLESTTLLAIAALILSLAIGYYLIRKASRFDGSQPSPGRD